MPGLLEELDAAERRFAELERLIADPAVVAGPRYQEYLREHGRLAKRAVLVREYRAAAKALAGARELAAAPGGDAELAALARAELPELERRAAALLDRLDELFGAQGEAESRDAVLELRAGVGGEEAALFARDLYRMYEHFCRARGWQFQLVDVSPTDRGGFKEAIVAVRGEGAYGTLRHEGGVHRVQRVPETEASGRIHTSAATVAVMPEAEEVEFELKPQDLYIEVVRSQGPGGQSVNTTDSAVFIRHNPTGEYVKCQIHKSQRQNKIEALKILRTRLFERERAKAEAAESALRRGQTKSGDRSDRVRTYNFPQDRVTDHRLEGEKNFTLSRVLEGELDPLLERLREREKLRRRAGEK